MLLLRSIFFTFLFPGTFTILVPLLIVWSTGPGRSLGAFSYFGAPLILMGLFVGLWSIWLFFAEGRGTIAPIDPPKELVISGPYLYVRNPMYVAALLILFGEALFFASFGVLIEAILFIAATSLFVVLYEEPHLSSTFGSAYDRYKRSVGRWIPRLRRYQVPSSGGN